jgi:hypothetical protein
MVGSQLQALVMMGASFGGALAPGNLPTVAGGIGETPPGGIAAREAVIWYGGAASSTSRS